MNIKAMLTNIVTKLASVPATLRETRRESLVELARGGCLSPFTHPSLSLEESAAAQKGYASYQASLKRLNKKHGL